MHDRDATDEFDAARDLPGLDLKRAKRYSRTRLAAAALGVGWLGTRAALFALSGASSRLGQLSKRRSSHPLVSDGLYVATVAAASWLSRLPADYLLHYRVERSYGLTNQPVRGWLEDQVKGLGVGVAFQLPSTLAAYSVIRRRPDDWWLVLSAVAVPLMAGLSQLAPVVLMPIFNRFDLLDDPALADRLRALSEQAGVPIADVYRMDLSRQSEKANAFFTGLGRTRRIVLADTLLAGFQPAEIEGIVAHEVGHQVHRDIWRLVALLGAAATASLYLAAKVAPTLIDRTRQRTGVDDLDDVASLPLLGLALIGASALTAPAQAAVSRAIERRTDRFAVELTGDGATYARALARLAERNLADPDPPRPLVWLLASHPSIAERIRMAKAFQSTSEQDGAGFDELGRADLASHGRS